MKISIIKTGLQIIRKILSIVKLNWKTKYKLVIRNDSTHQDKLALRLSPKSVFVAGISLAMILIVLTAMLIAFTPLRVYVPGYTTPDEYKLYRKLTHRIDSLDRIFQLNQQYFLNLERILNDSLPVEELAPTKPAMIVDDKNTIVESSAEQKAADAQVRTEAKNLMAKNNASLLPAANATISTRANAHALNLTPPLRGIIIKNFDPDKNHYGVDIQAKKESMVHCVADGAILYTGFDFQFGYVIVVQHAGNLLSVYKRNAKLLKKEGYIVTAGEPIAQLGDSGLTEQGAHLHFEIWYNGSPMNPEQYLVLK